MPAQSALITVMIKAADKAARSLKRDFGEVEQLQVSKKGPGDFVSKADKNAEKIIFDELSKARPTFSFLGEEGGEKGDAKTAEGRWIVDPLDGTNNFLHGVPHWCISIGCEMKGELVAGIVFDPIKDEMFWAEKGKGAYVNNRRIRVSGRKDPALALLGTNIAPRYPEFISLASKQAELMLTHVSGLRQNGAAALDLAWVAAGRLDAFWQNNPLPAWDVAAGIVLVTEAGGIVSRVDGAKYGLSQEHPILASNQELHAETVRLLKKAA